MAPVLLNLAKELAKDQKALDGNSMDRTSATYKMKFGLAKTFHEKTIEHLDNGFFSLNLDEATRNNHHRVLAVLVSYFPLK